MKKVIAAIDNSAAARPVLAMAQAVASALGGTLDVVHVIEDGDETARASAEAAGAALRTLSGDPVEQLARAVAEEDVVALVLGARGGLGGPRPAGHLALTLAGRTDKPVVVVPPDAQPPEQLHRVLVAMEGSPGKARALQRTIELSTERRPRDRGGARGRGDPQLHRPGATRDRGLRAGVLCPPRPSAHRRPGWSCASAFRPQKCSAPSNRCNPSSSRSGWPHSARSQPGRSGTRDP